MLILILFLIIGAILAYLSQNNLAPVTVHFGSYIFPNVPLFYVIIGSVVTGLVLSYVLYLLHAISMSFAIRGKDNEIKKNKDEVLELTKRVHQLELENEKLKHRSSAEMTEMRQAEDRNAL